MHPIQLMLSDFLGQREICCHVEVNRDCQQRLSNLRNFLVATVSLQEKITHVVNDADSGQEKPELQIMVQYERRRASDVDTNKNRPKPFRTIKIVHLDNIDGHLRCARRISLLPIQIFPRRSAKIMANRQVLLASLCDNANHLALSLISLTSACRHSIASEIHKDNNTQRHCKNQCYRTRLLQDDEQYQDAHLAKHFGQVQDCNISLCQIRTLLKQA
mmetsp:Transcript_52580/g.83534  ORF Transcript_52580/g.83534 Transcript_52580/m.83534 type:complete len:217 (-) Transcript_52580:25-675(-)